MFAVRTLAARVRTASALQGEHVVLVTRLARTRREDEPSWLALRNGGPRVPFALDPALRQTRWGCFFHPEHPTADVARCIQAIAGHADFYPRFTNPHPKAHARPLAPAGA